MGCGGVGRSAWLVPKCSSVPGPPAVCNNLPMEWANLWKKEEPGRTSLHLILELNIQELWRSESITWHL